MNKMKTRYRLTCRGIRGGMFYCVDKTTGKRTSLQTTHPDEARQIVEAKNQAERQPVLNLQIANPSSYARNRVSGACRRLICREVLRLVNGEFKKVIYKDGASA